MWADWSPCDVTCGNGTMTRDRNCTNGNEGDIGCLGGANDSSECNTQLCPIWDAWAVWSTCDAPCGNGTMTRDRNCTNGNVGDIGCLGDRNETLECNTLPCPIDGAFGAWSAWGQCSDTCGNGTTTRTRLCDNPAPANGGASCVGSNVDSTECNTQQCAPATCFNLERQSASCEGGTVLGSQGVTTLNACEALCEADADCNFITYYQDTIPFICQMLINCDSFYSESPSVSSYAKQSGPACDPA